MSSSLKKQAMHGAFWSFVERFGQQGVQLVVSIIIARLLEPKDFGVLGMLALFMALAQSVIDSGLGQALIQKQDAGSTDESTVFWFNLAIGATMAVVFFVVAPWIAVFYETPLLKSITRVFSLNLIINSFAIVQNALLVKELAFKLRMKAVLVSVVVSGLVGMLLAWAGWGVWALVALNLIGNLVRTVGLWVIHPWRPRLEFSMTSLRALWKFGSRMLFSGLLNTFFQNIYLVIIGKLYSATELGFYERGKKLMMLTSQSLSQMVAQVSFPVLSKMQGDVDRMRHGFMKALQTTMFATVPMMTGLAVVASDFIVVLLGEQWAPCVPYLKIMCISNAFFPIHMLNLQVLLALGRSDLFFRVEVMKKVITVVSILITFRYGVIGLLWGQVVGSFVCQGINTYYVKKLLGCGWFSQLTGVWRIILASVGMGLFVGLAGKVFVGSAIVRLFSQGILGVMIFVLLGWVLREPVAADVRGAVLRKLRGLHNPTSV